MTRSETARLRPLERKALLEELAAMLTSGELQLGEAARFLRSAVLGMDRKTFARVVKLSPRALANLEDDPEANPTVETLTKVFTPFGGKLSLVFPRMEEKPPLSEEQQRVRQSILTGLAKSRRRRRSSG